MPYYTTISKIFHCPQLDIDVFLTGKYRLSDNNLAPYQAKFSCATCSVVENSNKAIWEQSEEFKYFKCPNSSCNFSNEFEREIDLRKHGL